MAYRWINRHLKGEEGPVTEPDVPKIDGKLLRAFPDELPADELNTRIDEVFVPQPTNALPQTADAHQAWRARTMRELQRIVFRDVAERPMRRAQWSLDPRKEAFGNLPTEPGITIPWKYFPSSTRKPGRWLVVLDEAESLESKPPWLKGITGEDAVLLIAPRGSGPLKWPDPSPYYVQRSLPLMGRTVDSCRLTDVLMAVAALPQGERRNDSPWHITGRGAASIIAAYAALLEPKLSQVVVVAPPISHREGPIFLNVLRVLDVPEALGLLAPRPLTIHTDQPNAFAATDAIFRVAGGTLKRIGDIANSE